MGAVTVRFDIDEVIDQAKEIIKMKIWCLSLLVLVACAYMVAGNEEEFIDDIDDGLAAEEFDELFEVESETTADVGAIPNRRWVRTRGIRRGTDPVRRLIRIG